MRTYKIIISYDGSKYQGWQRQKNTDLTIQGILAAAIKEMVGYEVEVNGSGRTDSGVHAKGQCASVVLSGKVDEMNFLQQLNSILPEDIRVVKLILVKNGFHARHSAKAKRYEYVVDTREKPDVFTRRYCYHYPQSLNIEAMQEAAGYLTGSYDFVAFTDKKDEASTVRPIYGIVIKQMNEKVIIEYHGTGFLYHMVRILTGTLLEVGSGKRQPREVQKVQIEGKREQAGFLAPARGLCLKTVEY